MGKASRRKRERKQKRMDPNLRVALAAERSPEIADAMQRQHQAFIDKFGREPGPGDPIFFDPDADEPQPIDLTKLEAITVEAMQAAGMPPELVYAYQQTGVLPMEGAAVPVDDEDLEAFSEAVERYRRLHEGDGDEPGKEQS
jgi:hypothetical protein